MINTYSTTFRPHKKPVHDSVIALFIGFLLGILWPSICLSDDNPSISVREEIFKDIGRAHTKVVEQHFEEALTLLDKTLSAAKTSQEKAMTLNAKGYTYFIMDKPKKAIDAYEKALKQAPITNGLQYDLLFAIGQLYFSIENYKKTTDSLEKAIAIATKEDTAPHIILGQAYFRQGQFRNALNETKTAMAIATKQGIEPKEQWLALLRVLHLELNELTEVAQVLEKLVKRAPHKKYWLQLTSVYGTLGETQKQLTTMEIAYHQNLFTENKEYIYLAHLYLQANVPYKAAKLLNTEINSGKIERTDKNLFLESQSWLLAQEFEKSIPSLKEAAEISTEGNYFIQLGQIYMSLEQWENASQAFISALRKGKLHRPDNAYMALGTALFYQGALEAARDAFAEASKDERSEKVSKQWIDYLNSTLTAS